ncbi:M48 family metallopeptidase [Reyranella sp. CPCC 100927]|uniref:M48 family metallopeptidase n=1 Tax=Reyranella sp. CPCC 100927 TaxID=2599616 RepID=UPI0011B82720|nr:M48 family metallopeptidase [Reyranella sp. CPCC 100927]TWT14023.1 M48 family metallopeptidase [Reyranella sp. CPCC 100927]
MTQSAIALSMHARFYDGVHPVAHPVTIKATPAELVAATAAGQVVVRWPTAEIEVASDAEHEPHALLVCARQPGTRLAIEDDALRQSLAELGGNLKQAANRRPRIAPALGGVAGALALTVGLMAFAAEKLPNVVAPFVPHAWQRSLGDSVVSAMTDDMRKCTSAEGQEALQKLIDRLQQVSTYGRRIDVTVVQNPIVNAFAVPGGRLIVFSGLIDKASGPEEVAGVIAHEVGHVVHFHSMKGLLRAYGFDMMLKLVTGGYSSDVATLGGAGGVLLALRHSRDAEREADATALELMDRLGMRADGLSTFFGKLLDMQNKPTPGDKGKPKGDTATKAPRDAAEEAGILSTHPPTRERLEATKRPTTGAPAMSASEWQALRAVCRR